MTRTEFWTAKFDQALASKVWPENYTQSERDALAERYADRITAEEARFHAGDPDWYPVEGYDPQEDGS